MGAICFDKLRAITWRNLIVFFGFVMLHFVQKTYAASCTFTDGSSYQLSWAVDRNDMIHFHLQYHNFPSGVNAWTGVAFGESMFDGLDALVIKVINGRITVSDEYVQGYGPSWPDRQQDVKSSERKLSNGVLSVRFSRSVRAHEIGVDKDLNGCSTWQFITGPGIASPTHVGKHTRHPEGRTVCLDQCRA
ncbi:DOMON domain-containing protein [Ditylenchus destructor]|uniref:DOMON domain-containing protein n=1 Tax=Ditylenchus destructor TaxID=166010 RepID=A0AAD4R663_9BILA|nr:DOMON domain-containing protein [Ditylenchus destructor]